jgi:hypothetical protein
MLGRCGHKGCSTTTRRLTSAPPEPHLQKHAPEGSTLPDLIPSPSTKSIHKSLGPDALQLCMQFLSSGEPSKESSGGLRQGKKSTSLQGTTNEPHNVDIASIDLLFCIIF